VYGTHKLIQFLRFSSCAPLQVGDGSLLVFLALLMSVLLNGYKTALIHRKEWF